MNTELPKPPPINQRSSGLRGRDALFAFIGFCAGAFAFLVLTSVNCRPSADPPPQVAGQSVPTNHILLDFTRRYNVVFHGDSSVRTNSNVKLLGYTGQKVPEASGSISSGYEAFERWLVLELPDGRRISRKASDLDYLEEAQSHTEPR